MLDEDSILPTDRLRLLLMYLLYRDGLLPSDTTKLIQHAHLPPQDAEIISNLSQLGATTTRTLKDPRPRPQPLFPPPPPSQPGTTTPEDYSLSRFSPAIKHILSAHASASLSPDTFPYTKPELEDMTDPTSTLPTTQATSLRSAKPTWAQTRTNTTKPRQRVLVFMAGGATYSEARAVYEASEQYERDVYLVTSHMLTPALFVRQVRDLSVDPRRLGIPALAPPKKAPEHLFEPDVEPQTQKMAPSQVQNAGARQQVPVREMANVNLQQNGGGSASATSSRPQSQRESTGKTVPHSTWQPPEEKEKKKPKLKKLFGSSKG